MSKLLDKPQPAAAPRAEKALEPKKTAVARLVSLDAFRGFTMLAMVSGGFGTAHLLTDPTWGGLADQLEHRTWEGCTFWDLIQPSFMFIVGVAMPFAFALRQERGEPWKQQFLHVVKRSLLLICIGIFLDSFGKNLVIVQFIRVLQQIAIGYFIVFLVLHLGPKIQALAALALLGAHTAAFILYGQALEKSPWIKGDNIGDWIDKTLHLPVSNGGYVTINAISSAATILFGVLCGELLRSDWRPRWKITVLALASIGGLLAAWPGLHPGLAAALNSEGLHGIDAQLSSWSLTHWVPMIKKLWTSSFAIFAAGWTCLLMLVFYVALDVLPWRRWTFPFVVVGMNSIAIYVAAGTLGGPIRSALKPFIYEPLEQIPQAAPVIQASLVVVVLWLCCFWLYRHRIFFKV